MEHAGKVPVTRQDLVAGFAGLGIQEGEILFVHSSLRSFGYVEGGARTVVEALLELLGGEGTLAVPIFRRFFWEGPDQVWDRDHSPSRMGRISETVRTWPGARRSPHAPHPIAAVGRLAGDLTERYNRSDFAPDSPFARLVEQNAWIAMIGVRYNSCTLIHLIEERLEVPYRYWVELEGTVIENGKAERRKYPFLRRHEGVYNDFEKLGKKLEEAGKVRSTCIGESRILAFRSRDLVALGLREVRRDPLFLVADACREKAAQYLRSA